MTLYANYVPEDERMEILRSDSENGYSVQAQAMIFSNQEDD